MSRDVALRVRHSPEIEAQRVMESMDESPASTAEWSTAQKGCLSNRRVIPEVRNLAVTGVAR
jgi:hypothetical protein